MTESDDFATSTKSQSDRVILLLVCLCFALSGAAALIYQIAWTRQFALVFGTSELAIAAVLASYMGGLALGAMLIERRLASITRPVLWYGALELGIGASALLLVPAGLWLAEQCLIWLVGGQATPPSADHTGSSLFFLLASFVILMIPTTLMGATLPLLARHVVHDETQIGQRVGLLYACNTAGSVVGALLAALLLLPAQGLHNTLRVAAAINLLVGVCAVVFLSRWLNRNGNVATKVTALSTSHSTDTAASQLIDRCHLGTSPCWVLPLMLVSGAVSFLHEVLWTRMIGHIVGGSIHAFGIMLASFLAGLAAGGAVGAKLASEREDAARWLAISELLSALAAIGAWLALQRLNPEVGTLEQRLVFGFALLLPLAFAIGMTYPLAVRVLARTPDDAAHASARVYSWNTTGAILGSILGGFLILPALRYEGSVQLAVLTSAVLAVVALATLFKPDRITAAAVLLISASIAVGFQPQMPERLLRYSPLRVNGEGELLFYAVGRSATVTMLRQGDQFAIRTNGLPEASIDAIGTPPQMYVEAWMAPLAVLARPHIKDMLIVGLGGGRVVEAVPAAVNHVDVVELENEVVLANQRIAQRRLRDPLGDPRVNVIGNDARGALQLTDKHYDAVLSQPSHPWTAGASHLYTREFMQQVKQHLNPGGVFVQWMNVDFLDESLLRSLIATIRSVYPHVRVYRPAPPTLLFLASDQPIEPERQLEATRAALLASNEDYARMGIHAVEDLVASWALDDEGARDFAGHATLITDDRNRFSSDPVYDHGRNMSVDDTGRLLLPHDPLLQTDNFLYHDTSINAALDWGYVARRAALYTSWDSSTHNRLMKWSTQLRGTDMESYIESASLQGNELTAQAQQSRLTGVAQHGHSELLIDSLLEPALDAIINGNEPEQIAPLIQKGSTTAQLLIQATRLARDESWTQLKTLEAPLAQISWTSVWHARATQLRAEWRVHDNVPTEQTSPQQYGNDIVKWMDQLSQIQSNPEWMRLRLEGGQLSQQPAIVMESINRYLSLISRSRENASDADKARVSARITAWQPLLNELSKNTSVDKTRLAEVQTALNSALEQWQ